MRHRKYCLYISLFSRYFLSILILLIFSGDIQASARVNFNPNAPAIPGEAIVKFRENIFDEKPALMDGEIRTSKGSINNIFDRLSVKSMKRVFHGTRGALGDIYHLRFASPVSLKRAMDEIASDPSVEWIEPNYIFSISDIPNDYSPSRQWGLAKIQADLAWDISHGDPDIVIAVIDTGVDHDHPDLADNIWHNPGEIPDNGIDDDGNGYMDDDMGWDFVSVDEGIEPKPAVGEDISPPDRDPMDFQGHGTHCAGIISAVTDNGIGVAGVGWSFRIMALRAGYKTADGGGSLLSSDSLAAIEYAVDNGANVISMSWGGEEPSLSIRAAIQYALEHGCVLVAAAGNKGNDTPEYPAAFPGVIGVAASDHNDSLAWFSNYGDWVDIAAPGVDIYSTLYNDTYALMSGTSMAAPLVAGVAGLILSREPVLSPESVRQKLLDSADALNWDINPKRRLNAYRAVQSGFHISLKDGWNMISIPYQLADTSISEVLASISSSYQSIFTYDAESMEWKYYIPNNGFPVENGLGEFAPGRGYWIEATSSAELWISEERISDVSIPLFNGWNLIGCISPSSQPVSEALSSIDGKYRSILHYDCESNEWQFYMLFPDGAIIIHKLTSIEPGKAYWIDVSVECQLETNTGSIKNIR